MIRYGRLGTEGRVTLAEMPAPRPGPGEVVITMAACGICGTDLEKVKGEYTASSTLGHEPVGLIDSVGDGVKNLRRGDRVFAHHHVPCGKCELCAKGDYTFCPEYKKTNLEPGGFADQFKVSAAHVSAGAILPLDRSVSWEVGTLLEPAACVVTALRRIGFTQGESVFIYGLGGVGHIYMRIAHVLGASWVGGADISLHRREAARANGIDAVVDPSDAGSVKRLVHDTTGGRGVNLVVVATSASSPIAESFEIVRQGGTVNLFGVPSASSRIETNAYQFYSKGLRLISSYAATDKDIAEVHHMVVSRNLELQGIVSNLFPLNEIEAAFALAQKSDAGLRVAVTGPAFDLGVTR